MTSERMQRRIDRLLDQADEAAEVMDWSRVQQAAEGVLAVEPDNADAQGFLAIAERASAVEGAAPIELKTQHPNDPATEPSNPHQDSTATSFANDRYRVRKFLGEGGKKRVYQAHDTLLDREVAFALLKTEGFDQTSKERISREAQAMGRLGVHPNIVAVLDLGQEDDGSPYMVTELMGGGDIEGALEDAEENRLSLERTIEIGKAVCEGLEFAHARGIVHRDLKPGNVWLTDEGIAKIGDFGLAVMTDRTRLTREGMMVGTVSYMPPEQATGGDIMPKADLYSLGAMLYEMVTGRPPFLGDDEIAIIGQHINTPPVAPTWHNSNCPRPLEALIMRLLSKDPSERPESAQDVFNALDAIDLAARGETVEREGTSLESLAGGVFVGRQAEMDQLKAALEDVLGGRGRLVTLVGEPGIGKTRTSEELATYAGLRGALVLWGRCYEGGGAPPYWPWVQAIRSYVREIDPDELRRQMGSSASVVAEIVTDVKDRLPELLPPPQLDDPNSARFRLFDSITSFLKTASQSQPLVIVLDDLHWSDQPSLSFLEFIARELNQSRVLLLCTYRDMELNRRHPLSVTLGDLARDRLYSRVLLRGLTQTDIARFIEIAAGFKVPTDLSATVHRHTEGNPLFVTEVVRDLVQSGELTEENIASRSSWSVRIPEGVREVIGRRLDRLSDRTNDMLTIAAVIGRQFSLDALSGLVEDASESQLLDVLDEALASKLIEELPDEIGRYEFTHALIQETLTGELSLTRRVRLHARIAETLERIYGDRADERAVELAYHFGEAEAVADTRKLVHYSTIAGEQALATAANEEAVAHFDRALAGRGDDPVDDGIAALHFGRGRAHGFLIKSEEAVRDLTVAFDHYESVGRIEDVVMIAGVVVHVGRIGEGGMLPMRKRALDLVEPGSLDEGRLLVSNVQGSGANAEADADKALEIALDHNDQLLELQARYWTAYLQTFGRQAGRPDSEYVDRCLELIETITEPDPEAESGVRMFAGDDLANSGRSGEAFEQWEAAIAAAQRVGHRQRIASVCEMAVQLASDLGEWDRSREFYGRGQREWADEGRAIANNALVEFEVGNFAEGESQIARLEVLRASAPITTGYNLPPDAVSNLARALPHVVRITGSDKFSDASRSAAEELLNSDTVPMVIANAKRALSEVLAESGDIPEAARLYDEIADVPRRDHYLAWTAAAAGRTDDALARFESVIEFARNAGYRPVHAWACEGQAEVLLDRDDPSSASGISDREKAMELQDEALAITRELGMRPLTERILARREILRA